MYDYLSYTWHTCIYRYIHTLHYITLDYIRLDWITSHYITLDYITLHSPQKKVNIWVMLSSHYYITLHYINLHLHLHYITYILDVCVYIFA